MHKVRYFQKHHIAIFVWVVLTFVSNLIVAQRTQEIVGTTLSEYNQMNHENTDGSQKGFELKPGYALDSVTSTSKRGYSFSYFFLIRVKTDDIAGICVKAKSKVWGDQYFFGVPMANERLYARYEERIYILDSQMALAFSLANSELLLKGRLLPLYPTANSRHNN